MGIGDWGLGIGDWGLGPIPNPQSPIPIYFLKKYKEIKIFFYFQIIIIDYYFSLKIIINLY